ncbi:UNVERIFIED_CONTAM: hypothetical protein K2H54_057170 [Gekko kuhli]
MGTLSAFAEASVQTFEGEKVFRVTPHNEEQVEVLTTLASNMQVDFWHPDSVTLVKTGMTVDFRVEADLCSEAEKLLQQNGLNYEVLIDNLQTALDGQFDSHVRSAGHQYEKYNNWEKAVRTYGTETIMTHLLDQLDFYILPVFNIDGYVYTWTKSRMWRKTRSTNAGSSCIGTDPNRNFNAGWCSKYVFSYYNKYIHIPARGGKVKMIEMIGLDLNWFTVQP